eukprot:TRINITY_DN12942_c0_g1_i1.p1 TRINITY_DN12942_c0_g1~~TRINITY_DN12942_c0_g1_i1.p1  ORF type:complete len:1345 (-),score=164.93 TRINITY_DN12942_c0_g1_i1:112-4146(-)
MKPGAMGATLLSLLLQLFAVHGVKHINVIRGEANDFGTLGAFMQIGADAATPALKPFLEQIEKLVNDTILSIEAKRAAALIEINQSNSSFEHCDELNGQAGDLEEKKRLHIECRNNESLLKDQVDINCSEAHAHAREMWAACDIFHDQINPIDKQPVPQICAPNPSESNEDHAKRLKDWFADRAAEWHRGKARCQSFYNRSKASNASCDAITQDWASKVSQCDNLQYDLDAAACISVRQHSCEEHQACWEKAAETYVAHNSTFADQVENWKVEKAGLERILCLVQAIGSKHTEIQAEIEICRVKKYDTSWADLPYLYYKDWNPFLPPRPPCHNESIEDRLWSTLSEQERQHYTSLGFTSVTWDAAERQAANDVVKLKPGTIAYMEYYYQVPANAPPAKCRCDCCTLCLYYDYCDGRPTRKKSTDPWLSPQDQSIEAFSKEECCETVHWEKGEWNPPCQAGCGHDEQQANRVVQCVSESGIKVNDTSVCGETPPPLVGTCPATPPCPNCSLGCPIGFWRQGCDPNAGQHGSCFACTKTDGHYFTSEGLNSDSCATQACDPNQCGPGEYLQGCDGSDSPGECTPCSPVNGSYFETHGDLLDGSCVTTKCPTCPPGQYNSGCTGSSAGSCEPCSSPANHYFISPGWESATSCGFSQCQQNCPLAFKRQGCGGSSPGSCESCGLQNGTYAIRFGRLLDRCGSSVCDPSRCQAGEYLAGCGGASPGVCTTCPAPPTNMWYPVAQGLGIESCAPIECKFCHPGYYRSGCGGPDNPTSGGSCLACTVQVAGYYFTGHGNYSDTCSSARCQDAPACDAGMYRHGCGGHSVGNCQLCERPAEDYYITGPGQLTNDSCPTAACNGDICPIGQYLRKCGGHGNPLSQGVCFQCTHPDDGYFLISNGGLRNACASKSCLEEPKCRAGMWRKSCGGRENPTSAGTCDDCTNVNFGFYFIGDGGITGSCLADTCDNAGGCPIGQFRKGCGRAPNLTSTGVCANCTHPPEGTYLDSAGQIEDANCHFKSCKDLLFCAPGKYRRFCGHHDNPTSKGFCDSCTAPPTGYYYTGDGGLRDDCEKTRCPKCSIAEYREGCGGASGVSLGSCKECSAPPAGFYITGDGGVTDNCETASCADLSSCAAGEYRSGCGTASNPTFTGSCTSCSPPPAGFYYIGDGGVRDDCTKEDCKLLPTCDIGKYRSGCGGNANVQGEVSVGTSQGECVACTNVPNGTFISGPGDITDNCATTNCSDLPGCISGYFRSGCGNTSQGTCLKCTDPAEGEYYTSHGGLLDACPTARCENLPNCPVGRYRRDCGGSLHPTKDGTCVPCVLGKLGSGLPAAAEWTTHGGLNDSCEYGFK